MNPGITEEAGQTARSFIETLKENPALLVMAVANLALVIFCYFALVKGAELRSDLIKQIFTYQKDISEVLARCTLGPKQ